MSVQMKSLHNAGEAESNRASRMMTYLEGKPEEDNSMSIKRGKGEGMYPAARAASCAHG